MWKLYDDLYIGIPSGIRIDECKIGRYWTAVRANGCTGIAKTLEMPEDPEQFAASFKNGYLRDTANHMKWENLALAQVGVAAMNAWYNTSGRADMLKGLSSPVEFPGKIATVGNAAAENGFPLPMSPEFDAKAYASLRDFDAVVIDSEALITRALPGLLDIAGESGNVILSGCSLPCTALFFAFGMPVRELRGSYIDSTGAGSGIDADSEVPGSLRAYFVYR